MFAVTWLGVEANRYIQVTAMYSVNMWLEGERIKPIAQHVKYGRV